MAISSRGEGGVGGGGRGMSGGGGMTSTPKKVAKKAVLSKAQQAARKAKAEAAAARKAASTPSVKVIPKGPNATPSDAAMRRAMESYRMEKIKSGEYAKITAPNVGTPKARIKIDTNPFKTSGFANLRRKMDNMDTPANRAKAQATARALKAANKKKK